MPTISTLTVDVQSRTSRFSTGLKTVIGGLGALAAGAAFAFKQFEDSQKISNQTAAALESTGHAARISQRGIEGMASRLSALTGVDDELIQSGENLLLTFTNIRNKVGGEFTGTFDRATATVLDMSVAMGQDMKSSAIQIGKALNDPIAGLTSLTRVGVQFDAQTKKQIATLVKHGEVTRAQGIILDELTKEFGGSAEAQATATGKMSVAFGNLAETVGGLVAPAFEFLAREVQGMIEFFQQKAGPAFEKVMEWLRGIWEAVKPVVVAFGRELFEALQQTWTAIQQRVWPALKRLFEALEPVLRIVGLVIAVIVKLALEALPVVVHAIGIVIAILAKLVDGLVAVVNFVREKFVEPIVGALQRVGEAISTAAGWVKDRFLAAWNAIKAPVLAVLNAIKNAIEAIIGAIQTAIERLSDFLQLGERGLPEPLTGPIGGSVRTGPFPEAQTGGFVARSGAAIIHRGETIMPALGLGGGDIVLQVDGQTFARITRDQLLKLAKRNGSTGI